MEDNWDQLKVIGVTNKIDLLPKTKLEIILNDEYADIIVENMVKSEQTGSIGDGTFLFQILNMLLE